MAKNTTATATATRKLRPIHDKVLVQRDEAADRTDSGIFLPEKAKDTPQIGTVQAVGAGRINSETGERIPVTVKTGDRVIFTSYAGTEVKLDGDEYLVMSESEILAIID